MAAAAVLSLISPGAWGAWQGAGARNASLASARLGHSLSGSNVTGGGTGYSKNFVLPLAGLSTDHFSVTNTGSVAETIGATATVSGLNLGSVAIYGCPNSFSSGITCTGRVTLATGAGALAVQVTGVLGLSVTVAMAANTFTITPRTGINRTSG